MTDPTPRSIPEELLLTVVGDACSREAFQATCREAVRKAAIVQPLRVAYRRTPATGTAMDFLGALVSAAQLSLAQVRERLELTVEAPNPEFAAAWGRFAVALRLPWPDARDQLRTSWLAATGHFADRPSPRGHGLADDIQSTLDSLPPEQQVELNSFVAAAAAAFTT